MATIKLSEAIMLNGMTKPQGHGSESIMSCDAPCVLGGALQVIGKQDTQSMIGNYRAVKESWPWTCVYPLVECPECEEKATPINIIWQLNDVHYWTRQQIAEWVATIEPEEVIVIEEQEAACTTAK